MLIALGLLETGNFGRKDFRAFVNSSDNYLRRLELQRTLEGHNGKHPARGLQAPLVLLSTFCRISDALTGDLILLQAVSTPSAGPLAASS